MKFLLIAVAVLAVFGLSAGPVKAQNIITGADLLADCQAHERIQSFIDASGDTSHFSAAEWIQDGYCVGFVMGVANAELGTSFISNGVVSTVSTPNGYTGKQIVKILISYAESHPETANMAAEDVVIRALGTAGILTKTDIGVLAPLTAAPKPPTSAPKQSVNSGQRAAA